jgi:hypothetical protein
MRLMKWWKTLSGTSLVAAVLFSSACSHEPGVQASGPSFGGGDNLPFERTSDKGGISPTASLAPAEIPTGMPITVRIESAVSSANSHPGDPFQAVLDVPIVVDGATIAAAGSAIAGKVVGAKAASPDNEFGFVRLTLASVTIDGRTLPLQTANVFVKAAASYPMPARHVGVQAAQRFATKDVEFPAERRLTFRLTQAISTRP